jgi:hypothetical protein
MAKEEVKSVVFKNFTEEEFVCSWDSVPYRFPAGKEMYVEDWKAIHFAKHLVNKVMHKAEMITTNMIERNKFLALALPNEEAITPEEALDLNAREEIAEKAVEVKKAGRPKKVVEEEEFAGLNKK